MIKPAPGPDSADSRGSADRPVEDWWNEISIVHYPSIRHFCDMLAAEDYQEVNRKYRLGVSRPPIPWIALTSSGAERYLLAVYDGV